MYFSFGKVVSSSISRSYTLVSIIDREKEEMGNKGGSMGEHGGVHANRAVKWTTAREPALTHLFKACEDVTGR